jgi:peptidyl-prolyl cis-trans isomerase C
VSGVPCAAHTTELPERCSVSVNGVDIPHEAIAREVQYHPAAKPIAAWQAAARALVVRELLLQEARRLGIEPAPLTDPSGRREAEEEALVRELIEREVTTPEPDEASCRCYYEQNRRRFRSAPIYEAAHILFPAREDVAEEFEAAERAADLVLGELKSQPGRFAGLARAHSACPSAAQGGNLGQMTAGQTTREFEEALAGLAPGAISQEPVKTRYGLHIIRLDRRIEGQDLPFELVSDRIADYLRENVARRATAQYVARLVSQAEISGIALAGAPEHQVS